MVFRTNRLRLISAAALVAGMTTLAGLGLAQSSSPTQSRQAPDPLRHLTQALSKAGADALSTEQQAALNTLITDFQSADALTPSATRLAYDNYILAGDAPDAIALLPALEAERATQAEDRKQAVATFAADAIKILTPAQVKALQQSLGADETVRLIQSLSGPAAGRRGPR